MPVTNSVSSCGAPSFTLPATIRLEPGLERVVRPALQYSPRFREQCRVLAASPGVSARVRLSMRRAGTTARAFAIVRRGAAGTFTADIEITEPAQVTELLAHELEHVIEQIDGVNLPALAGRGEAHRLRDGAFETERAVTTGLLVAGEVFDNAPDRVRGAGGTVWRTLKGALWMRR